MKEGVNMDCIIKFIDGSNEVHHDVVSTQLYNCKSFSTFTLIKCDNTRVYYNYEEIESVKFERR